MRAWHLSTALIGAGKPGRNCRHCGRDQCAHGGEPGRGLHIVYLNPLFGCQQHLLTIEHIFSPMSPTSKSNRCVPSHLPPTSRAEVNLGHLYASPCTIPSIFVHRPCVAQNASRLRFINSRPTLYNTPHAGLAQRSRLSVRHCRPAVVCGPPCLPVERGIVPHFSSFEPGRQQCFSRTTRAAALRSVSTTSGVSMMKHADRAHLTGQQELSERDETILQAVQRRA
jgi:hypothetical protein